MSRPVVDLVKDPALPLTAALVGTGAAMRRFNNTPLRECLRDYFAVAGSPRYGVLRQFYLQPVPTDLYALGQRGVHCFIIHAARTMREVGLLGF